MLKGEQMIRFFACMLKTRLHVRLTVLYNESGNENDENSVILRFLQAVNSTLTFCTVTDFAIVTHTFCTYTYNSQLIRKI
jgi:hypothetical protein